MADVEIVFENEPLDVDKIRKEVEGKPRKSRKTKEGEPKTRFIQQILKNPASFVNALVTKTETVMEPRASSWRRYRAKYRIGLKYQHNVGSMSLFVANYIYSNVETVKSNVGKAMPVISLEDPGIDDVDQLDMLTRLVKTSLIRGGLYEAQQEVVHHAAICGHAAFKLSFDDEAADGEGDNVIECVQPEDLLVDPLAVPFWDKDGRTRARYIIHRRRDVSIDEIEATYGVDMLEDADEISEEHELIGAGVDSTTSSGSSVRQRPYGDPQNTLGRTYDVYECWLQTYEPYEEDDKGNVVSSPWYIITVAGNKVLKKGYSPYAHRRAPFYVWFDVSDTGALDFYHTGVGEVEEIEMIQDRNSILDLQILRNIRQTVNRQRVVNRLMGLTKDDVDNVDGRVYEVAGDPNLAIRWDNPPQLGTDVYTYRMQGDTMIQLVSGVTDVQGGRKPTGIAAAKAIQALQEASEQRVKEKQKSLVAVMRFIVQDALSNIFQFYPPERIVRLVGGMSLNIAKEYPPELQPGYTLPVEPVPEGQPQIDPFTGQPIEQGAGAIEAMPAPEKITLEEGADLDRMRMEWRQMNSIDLVLEDVKLQYDAVVSFGSALPEDKGERGALAMDLFRLNAIDRQALLEALEWPDRGEILKRMGNETSEQAKASAQPQMTPGGAPGGLDPMMLMQLLQSLGAGQGQGGVPPMGM